MKLARVSDVCFQPLVEQSDDIIESVRQIRNSDAVRKNMYNDHLISVDEHKSWIDSLRGNSRENVMTIHVANEVVGLVALRNIRQRERISDWAFYLSESMQGKGIGGVVEYKLLQLAFKDLNLVKLNCEVIETNVAVIGMHQKFGFKLEGTRRAHALKDGEYIDVCFLGILADEWNLLQNKFARLFGDQL